DRARSTRRNLGVAIISFFKRSRQIDSADIERRLSAIRNGYRLRITKRPDDSIIKRNARGREGHRRRGGHHHHPSSTGSKKKHAADSECKVRVVIVSHEMLL